VKFRKTILLTPILLLACNVIMGIPTPTPARRTPTPTNTPRSFTSTPSPTPSSTPIPTAPVLDLADQAAAMLPGFAGDIDALQPATQYAIDARVSFDPDLFQASIEGEARIFFTNPLDESLEDFALMLWPNDEQYLAEMQAERLLSYRENKRELIRLIWSGSLEGELYDIEERFLAELQNQLDRGSRDEVQVRSILREVVASREKRYTEPK